MLSKFKWMSVLPLMILSQIPLESYAAPGLLEASVGFSFYRSRYTASDFQWTRRWRGSIAYHFTQTSGVELAYSNITTRTKILGLQDTTFNDSIYSLNWVQSFLPREYTVQPYIKLGLGQLNRDATGTYASGASPPLQVDSLTVVLSLGVKIKFLKNFAIRTEVTTYMEGGSLATWQDNLGFTVGLSSLFPL